MKKPLPIAYEPVDEYFSKRLDQLPVVEGLDFGSGRIEHRRCYVEMLDGLAKWSHLRSVVRVDASREMDGQTTTQTPYYLSSLVASPADFNRFIRQYWRIGNSLHWQPDVVFRERRQRTRLDNGPLNLATARRLALQSLHQVHDANSLKNRRKMAGWDEEYLSTMLAKITSF